MVFNSRSLHLTDPRQTVWARLRICFCPCALLKIVGLTVTPGANIPKEIDVREILIIIFFNLFSAQFLQNFMVFLVIYSKSRVSVSSEHVLKIIGFKKYLLFIISNI